MNFNFNKQTLINIVIAIAIIIASYLAIVGFKCLYSMENFSDIFDLSEFTTDKFTYSYLDKKYLTTKHNNYMVNGIVYKQNYDGAYNYLYKFNLPIPVGGDYNKIEGEYLVLSGVSKDTLKPIGKLERSSDGWFYLQDITKEDYKYTQLIFNVKSDPSKNIIILEKNI